MRRARPAARAGFTLIEVMAAVAVLGLFGTVLAQQAIQGMHYEGDARRRLQASLLADRALWQVEAGLKLGTPPQPKQEETETEEGFRVLLDVQPLDLAQLGLAPKPDAPGAQRDAPPGAPPGGDAAALPLPIFQVFVRVAWTEGLVEQTVTRTTFAFDGTAVGQALGAAQEQPTAPPPEEEAE
jgi:prepilin-type N-terminal cleavage/methylation domain-containing protein